MMKKSIAIMFILLIGLIVLGGCTSTTVEPINNQEKNQQNTNEQPEQNQRQAGSGEIPIPPSLP